MTTDRRTKAQILADLEEKATELTSLKAEVRKLRDAVTTPPSVPLADAVAGCVRALDRIAGTSVGYGSAKTQEIGNVITLLCDKYGVKRVHTVTEPCHRRHAEELTTVDLLEIVRKDMGQSRVFQ